MCYNTIRVAAHNFLSGGIMDLTYKKIYLTPVCDVIFFDSDDIITTSNSEEDDGKYSPIYPLWL